MRSLPLLSVLVLLAACTQPPAPKDTPVVRLALDVHNPGDATWVGLVAITSTSGPIQTGCGAIAWSNLTVPAKATQNAITLNVRNAAVAPGHCILLGQGNATLWDSGRDPCLAGSAYAFAELTHPLQVRITCPDRQA